MPILKVFKNLISRRQVLFGLVIRNLNERYGGSSLGMLWVLITPFLIMLAISFVFGKIMGSEMPNLPLLILSALLPWFFFINSICESVNAFKQHKDILTQFAVPKEMIPLSIVISNLIIFLLSLAIMLPVFIISNNRVIYCLAVLPLLIILHFIFTLGISIIFSIVGVYFRDLAQVINVGVMFFFWITPIFYSSDMIPKGYAWLNLANPAAPYINMYRMLLYKGDFLDPYLWFFCIFFAVLSMVIAFYLIRLKSNDLLKNI
ncbi:MAG: ABC transporter permease [Candidatus Omnitrophota bacterium]|nr:ABC transporter permease [Candidatus Omnitrophota bacterium]